MSKPWQSGLSSLFPSAPGRRSRPERRPAGRAAQACLLAVLLGGLHGLANDPGAIGVAAPPPVAFAPGGQSLGAGGSWDVSLLELDGSGRMSAYFENRLWLNDGQGQFAPGDLSFCPGATYTSFADLDNDGYTDAVCNNTVFFNDGQGRFSRTVHLPSPIGMLRPFLLDVNGDGAIDVIVASESEDRLLLNDGHGAFTGAGLSFGGWGAGGAAYAAADFDRDGVTDVLASIPLTPQGADGRVRIWLGDGGRSFTEAPNTLPASHSVAVADFDRDGAPDLFLGLEAGGGRLYLNDGRGRFADSGQQFGDVAVGAVAAGDFNGDGYPDLFLANCFPPANPAPNTVWLNDGNGRFSDSGLRLGSATSHAVALGDLNGDGRTDAFVGNVTLGAGPAPNNEVWLNTGTSASGLRAAASDAEKPILTADGVVNAAGFAQRLAPDSFVSIFGRNLASSSLAWDSAVPDGRTLPRSLGGVRVTLDGRECFPSFVSPAQVNILVPPGVPAGRRTLTLSNEKGSASVDVLVEPASPGFFTYVRGGTTYAAAVIATARVFVAEPGTFPGEQCRRARPSDYVVLFVNGLGAAAPHPLGEVLQAAFPVRDLSSLSLTVGGKAAPVLWAGLTFAGLFQVNVQLPADVAAGDLPIVIAAGGRSSETVVYLPVEAAPANVAALPGSGR